MLVCMCVCGSGENPSYAYVVSHFTSTFMHRFSELSVLLSFIFTGHVCVCVCVREKEGEIEGKKETEKGGGEGGTVEKRKSFCCLPSAFTADNNNDSA